MIIDKLRSYIKELKESGMSDESIEKLGVIYLKKIVKEAPLKEREQFFVSSKRDQKLKQILDF